tara:strand:+ start:451 stop:1137 length:687 start_codon:yes stop_codon:yes gene_type:complete
MSVEATVLAVVAIFAVVFFAFYLLQRHTEKKKILKDRERQIASSDHKYGWFDPEMAKRFGSSVYDTIDGKETEVTFVSNDKHAMSRRRFKKGMVYRGELKRFNHRGQSGSGSIDSIDIDLVDVALLFFIHVDLFLESYPYDPTYFGGEPPLDMSENIDVFEDVDSIIGGVEGGIIEELTHVEDKGVAAHDMEAIPETQEIKQSAPVESFVADDTNEDYGSDDGGGSDE